MLGNLCKNAGIYFGGLPESIDNTDLSPMARLLLAVLDSFGVKKIEPKLPEILQRMGLEKDSQHTVYRCARELVLAGILEVESGAAFGRGNRYHVQLPHYLATKDQVEAARRKAAGFRVNRLGWKSAGAQNVWTGEGDPADQVTAPPNESTPAPTETPTPAPAVLPAIPRHPGPASPDVETTTRGRAGQVEGMAQQQGGAGSGSKGGVAHQPSPKDSGRIPTSERKEPFSLMAAPEGWEAFTVEATRRSELVFLWTPRNRDLAHQVEQLLGGRRDWLPQVHQRFLAKDFWCRNGYPLEALIKNLHQFAPRQLRPAVKKIYTPTCDHADMEPAFKTQSDGSQLVTWTCTCGHVETETRTEEEIAAAQRFLQGAGVDLAAVAGT